MSYLIDTNIFIFALKDPGRAVAQRLASVSFRDRVLSSVVEAELYHGAEKYGKAQECRELLREYLSPYQRQPFDSACVPHYAGGL
jgi:predicted nucleic acid-binding protein